MSAVCLVCTLHAAIHITPYERISGSINARDLSLVVYFDKKITICVILNQPLIWSVIYSLVSYR